MFTLRQILGPRPPRVTRGALARHRVMGLPGARLWLGCVLGLSLLGSGCGQKGPLYLPEATTAPSPTPSQLPSDNRATPPAR